MFCLCLKNQSELNFYLMVPHNGSCEIEINKRKVRTISSEADLSKVITGLRAGDEAVFKGQTFRVEVVW
jgi:hypothetical protein